MALKVLVVDDEHANLQQILTYLKDLDIDLSYAMNGPDAIELTINTLPDLILLDVMLPGMDGFEICRRIRSDERVADIPVVFITARSEHEDLLMGFEAGGQDYLTKPFNPTELKARVLMQLDRRYAFNNIKSRNLTLLREVDDLHSLLRSVETDLEKLHKKISKLQQDLRESEPHTEGH